MPTTNTVPTSNRVAQYAVAVMVGMVPVGFTIEGIGLVVTRYYDEDMGFVISMAGLGVLSLNMIGSGIYAFAASYADS